MRVSIARIRLYLKTGKTLSDGSHPIMLMCSFQGRKEVSTCYSCDVKHWDKKGECVKKGYPNWVMINYEINRLKQEAVDRRNTYERLGEVYTPQMVLCPRKVLSAVRNDLNGLIRDYIDEKGLMNKTIEKWWVVYRSLVRFNGRDLIVNEIDESFCRRYARWLKSEGLSDGSVRSYLGKVGAICHYAISKGLMSVYPFATWKYHLSYRESKSELYIHHRSMDVMMQMFIDEVIERNGERWSYREGVTEKLLDIHSELYSHYLYLITYWLCGLAPVDVSLLKKKGIKTTSVRGKGYYVIDGRRSKTSMPYHMLIPIGCIESNVLIKTMLMFNDGTEYFLPTLKDFHSKDVRKRVNNLYTYHSGHLVAWFQKVNEEIVRRNMENGDDIELINLDCRYYSARHSYIMSMVQKPNVNLMKIATVTGKSVTTLHQYLTYLNDLDLAD